MAGQVRIARKSVFIQNSFGEYLTWEQIEQEVIKSLLIEFRGNVSSIADVLGTTRNTLYRKLHKSGIDPKEYRKEVEYV